MYWSKVSSTRSIWMPAALIGARNIVAPAGPSGSLSFFAMMIASSAPTAPVISHFVPSMTKSPRSEEHTSELQSLRHLVCRLLLEKKKNIQKAQEKPAHLAREPTHAQLHEKSPRTPAPRIQFSPPPLTCTITLPVHGTLITHHMAR